ncbi:MULTISPECIES: MadC family VWA domain-containing protein [unclassified Rhodococcus (in: high G+C Gram-positive bacteria)]|uniref:MadC family VWA domain-containing protein n=1 Tax=unclassified Rhodococcus (in: high G+C Gram-positive bacteria) TaxID=192944 RepID=UPI0002F945B5|nr:VWA domain-containing protein [Rhodococcus sp. DK17]
MLHPQPDPSRSLPAQLLDVLAASFGKVLRRYGVAASPAEVIEVRRVFGLIGGRDLPTLRASLRAVCAKYTYEQAGFDRAFDVFFASVADAAPDDVRAPSRTEFAEGLPTALEVADNAETARYAEYNERAAEVGDHFDTPEAQKGFNPHKDDDDVSMTSSDADLSVDSEAESGRRGVTYTVEVERAASTAVGDLASATSGAVVGSLSWDDPESILAWLDAYDPSTVYADSDGAEPLTAAQLNRLAEAVEAFVDALADARDLTGGPEKGPETTSGAVAATTRAEVNQACYEVLRRMRGPSRPRPRELARGRLDMRRTVRASLRTEGIPFHLMVKAPRPDRVRVLILADVSLSVRPVTAFTLRLAQAMHRRASRCQVLAFVDRPVDVTDTLLAGTDDDALASVLADPRIDLEASSDYGRVFADVLTEFGTDVNSRTSVVVVGDGRCNGLPPGVDEFAELRRKVHRLAWITPEPERYWNQASCAMPEYADICDRVVVARDAAQLMSRAAELGHALR